MQKMVPVRSVVLGARALVAALGGLYITFAQGKGWHQTLLILALYCIGQLVVLALAFALERDRGEFLAALPGAALALAVAILASMDNSNEPPVYNKVHWLLIIWGLLSGAFELWQARRSGASFKQGSETYIGAVLALLLAAALLLVPEIDIIATEGMLGAYLIINAVNYGIAATSPKSPRG